MKRRAQPWLGTIVEIGLVDDLEPSQAQHAFQIGFDAIRNIHELMSFHSCSSDVGRYNLAPIGMEIDVSPHTFKVLEVAAAIYNASDGLFNVCNAQLLVQWGCLPAIQERALIDTRDASLGYRLIEHGRIQKCHTGVMDLGGIAKGYAVDYAVSVLTTYGVKQMIINAGGDMRVVGTDAIEVHIRDPKNPQKSTQTLHLQNTALATSGSYFSQRSFANHKVSALINSKTREPILSQSSFSVIAPECVLADALTKVLAVSGNAQHPCFHNFGANAFII